MAKATTIKDAIKKLEETKGISAVDAEKVPAAAGLQALAMHPLAKHMSGIGAVMLMPLMLMLLSCVWAD